MKFKAILIVGLLLIASVGWATNYYIDPSATYNGDGTAGTQATGAGTSGAYNTWGSVTFAGGDDYYQKCGTSEDISTRILVNISGSNTEAMILGAYYLNGLSTIIGISGNKPIIDVGSRSSYCIWGVIDYITLTNLDIRGSTTATIMFQNTDYGIVDNCTIGYGAAINGLVFMGNTGTYNECMYGEIHNCIIESGFSTFSQAGLANGIVLATGCNYFEIHNNSISNWGHDGINLMGTDNNFAHGTTYNKIHNNLITAPDTSYCRGFEIQGIEGKCQYNEIYNNTVYDTTARNQINGDHNKIYNNLIYKLINSSDHAYGTAQGFDLQAYSPDICHDNIICNNTIVDCDEAGIRFRADVNNKEDNIIKNNVIINCGRASKDSLDGYGIVIDNDASVLGNNLSNNLVYKSGVTNVIYYRGTGMSISTWNADTSYGADTIADNVQSDPLLTSTHYLKKSSPCIDAGTTVSGITSEYYGSAVDIGAFEYDRLSGVGLGLGLMNYRRLKRIKP